MTAGHDHYQMDDLLSEAIAVGGPEIASRIETDPEAYLDLVVRTNQAWQRTGDMLKAAVLAARSAGHSWEAIGRALGMTRQAAQQRFGRGVEETGDATTPQRRRLRGLTAFNEMAVLERAGRFGWHSVDYGPYYHLLERDEWQWEHRRVYAWSANRAALEAEGWTIVGNGWFPWAYYARPTDIPAEERDPTYEELVFP